MLISELGLGHQRAVQNLEAEGVMGMFFVPERSCRGSRRGEREPGCGVIANHSLHSHLPAFFCTRSSVTFPEGLTHRTIPCFWGRTTLCVDFGSQVVQWEGREKGWPRAQRLPWQYLRICKPVTINGIAPTEG